MNQNIFEAIILEREAAAIMQAPFEQSLKLSAEQLAVFRRIAENMQERAAALRQSAIDGVVS
jgi:hypothetical protein